jgi:pterin-4a-carbinolamine dehydratase
MKGECSMSSIQPNPTTTLKPERIGLTAALAARSPLKPERIGFRLQKLPGWELLTGAEAQAVSRTFRFHRTATAQAFATFVARTADEHGQRPLISQSWNQVKVVVPGEGAVTDSALDFAEAVMLLPASQTAHAPAPGTSEAPVVPTVVVGSDEV